MDFCASRPKWRSSRDFHHDRSRNRVATYLQRSMVKTPRVARSPALQAAGVQPRRVRVRTARYPDIRVLAVKRGRAIEVQRVAVRARRRKGFEGRSIDDRPEVGRAAPIIIQGVTSSNVKITCA